MARGVKYKLAFLLDAIAAGDYSFRFTERRRSGLAGRLFAGGYGGSGRLLNATLNRIKDIIVAEKENVTRQEAYYGEILDNAATGIMVVGDTGAVLQTNVEARRLLRLDILTHINQLARVDERLPEMLGSMQAGENRRVEFTDERGEVVLSVKCSSVVLRDDPVRVFALGEIGDQLAEREIESWVRLIRVLTHEIMNSVSPITSLSDTLIGRPDLPPEVRSGLETIRATGRGLTDFVESYRRLTRLPQPRPTLVEVGPMLERAVRLVRGEFSMRLVDGSGAAGASEGSGAAGALGDSAASDGSVTRGSSTGSATGGNYVAAVALGGSAASGATATAGASGVTATTGASTGSLTGGSSVGSATGGSSVAAVALGGSVASGVTATGESPAGSAMPISIEVRVHPADVMIYADENLVFQVVVNLLKNAAQALVAASDTAISGVAVSGAGVTSGAASGVAPGAASGTARSGSGAIHATDGASTAAPFEPRIIVEAACPAGEQVIISVSDNGPGIPPDVLPNIFIPFFTTKESGSGIGLSLSRQIMRLHGGSLAVRSVPGRTTFSLVFP